MHVFSQYLNILTYQSGNTIFICILHCTIIVAMGAMADESQLLFEAWWPGLKPQSNNQKPLGLVSIESYLLAAYPMEKKQKENRDVILGLFVCLFKVFENYFFFCLKIRRRKIILNLNNKSSF